MLIAMTYSRHDEAGYTLVALLALMTIVALFAMAAAPAILQQTQREKEKEAIFRGEQVAEAIKQFHNRQSRTRGGAGQAAMPTSMDQLLEGIPQGTKKLQVLRPSAAHDPLSASGEWRLIHPREREIIDFAQAVILYSNNVVPPTTDPQLRGVQNTLAPAVISISGLAPQTTDATDVDCNSSSTGPFIGVASCNTGKSVINYYGIDHHHQWVFTPFFR